MAKQISDISVTAELAEATIEHPVLTGPDLNSLEQIQVLTGKDKITQRHIRVSSNEVDGFKVKREQKIFFRTINYSR